MITREDIEQAISECIRQQNPTANTCLKLAAYYTIRDHMKDDYSGDSEFMAAVKRSNTAHVLAVMDELMRDLQAVNPRMYDTTIRRILGG